MTETATKTGDGEGATGNEGADGATILTGADGDAAAKGAAADDNGEGKDSAASKGSDADDGSGGDGADGADGGDGAANKDDSGDDGEGADGPPEKYEFTAPEGMELDQQALERFEPFARKLGLNQATAQELVDLHAEVVAGVTQAQMDAHAEMVTNWAREAKDDPEFGGEAFTENVRVAQTTVARFGGDALKKLLNETGLGNHPELIRFFLNVGKNISEDGHVTGDDASHQRTKSPAEVFYPDMAKK